VIFGASTTNFEGQLEYGIFTQESVVEDSRPCDCARWNSSGKISRGACGTFPRSGGR